ncbi:MAG: hypothetical protein II152_05070, partial [Succinivibrionaceae bacterium]|nr:hypothetical protein [Succinivibrionaceae bacterium]
MPQNSIKNSAACPAVQTPCGHVLKWRSLLYKRIDENSGFTMSNKYNINTFQGMIFALMDYW